MEGDKLSDYERIRLDNINRNNAFLASLGLEAVKPKMQQGSNDLGKCSVWLRKCLPLLTTHLVLWHSLLHSRLLSFEDSAQIKRKKADDKLARAQKRARDLEQPQKQQENGPSRRTRSSARLSGIAAAQEEEEEEKKKEEEEEEEDGPIDYERLPMGPEDLDDQEFLLWIELRKWRLTKARGLDLEPYKIFQNRVICEAIRRRQLDAQWGREPTRDSLMECWGIARGKMLQGTAVEMMAEMETPEAEERLARSRMLRAAVEGASGTSTGTKTTRPAAARPMSESRSVGRGEEKHVIDVRLKS